MMFFILVAITILSGEYWKYYFILPVTSFIAYLSDVMFFVFMAIIRALAYVSVLVGSLKSSSRCDCSRKE